MKNSKKVKPGITPRNLDNIAILDSLAGLIGVLSRGQKRDFKKYAKFWGGAQMKYLKLFDIINDYLNAQKSPKLLLPFILSHKTYFSTKSEVRSIAAYLYERILESARANPDSNSLLQLLTARIQNIIFLFNKGLYNDCLDQIHAAKELAHTLDRPCYTLELSFWERRVRPFLHADKEELRDIEAYFHGLKRQERQVLSELQTFMQFNELADDLMCLILKKQPLSAETALQAGEATERLFEQSPPRTRMRFVQMRSYYHHLKSEEIHATQNTHLEDSWSHQKRLLSLYQQNPLIGKEEPTVYYGVIISYLNTCLRLNKMDEVERFEKELNTEPKEPMLLAISTSVRLQYFIKSHNFEQARQYIQYNPITLRPRDYLDKLPDIRLVLLFYTCAQVFFVLEDFRTASEWLNMLLTHFRSDIRPDIFELAKILEVLCLFELGAYRHDPEPGRPLNNLKRVLRRMQSFTAFKTQLFRIIDAVFAEKTVASTKKTIQAMDEEIEKQPSLRVYGIAVAWVKTHINGTPLTDEVRQYN